MDEEKPKNIETKAFNRDESRESLNRDSARDKLYDTSKTEAEEETNND